jgi:hypothetical protein
MSGVLSTTRSVGSSTALKIGATTREPIRSVSAPPKRVVSRPDRPTGSGVPLRCGASAARTTPTAPSASNRTGPV